MLTTLLLCVAAFFAGLTDSVGGGGGLIQLPALFIGLPNTFQASVLGTNKFSSVFGTAIAARTYSRVIEIDRRFTLVCAGTALCFSLFGALAVSRVHPTEFKPVMLMALVCIAAFTFARKDFGALAYERVTGTPRMVRGAIIGALIGFYDGFFGPGTGSILIFLFISWIGLDFLGASASAKLVNVSTNIGALFYFIPTGHILYRYAIPMAALNMLGSFVGARLAITKGNRFVRIFFMVVILGVIIRFAWDIV